MKRVDIFIEGQPHGKERARSRIVKARSGRPYATHYTPSKTRNEERRIAALGAEAMAGHEPTTEPVDLTLAIGFEIPKSWPKWKQQAALDKTIAPTGKPDLDNIIKSIKDGLNGIVWKDDAQVTGVMAFKYYAEAAGVTVIATAAGGISHNATRADVEQNRTEGGYLE